MQRLRALSEDECYARCYGGRDATVRIVSLEPRRPRYVPYISLAKYVAGQKNEIWRNYLPTVPGLRD